MKIITIYTDSACPGAKGQKALPPKAQNSQKLP